MATSVCVAAMFGPGSVMTYPPEPWHLRGQMYLSLWRVPHHRLPGLPPGMRPALLSGYGLAGTAWVNYEPGGDLAYNELLAAVLVRSGRHARVCVTHIWVDSIPSRDGARALWGLPKELAAFDLTTSPELAAEASTADGVIAAAAFRARAALPGTWPFRYTVTQQLHGRLENTPVRTRAWLQLATARWDIDAGGPLAWLHGLRPFVSVGFRDFRLRFGG